MLSAGGSLTQGPHVDHSGSCSGSLVLPATPLLQPQSPPVSIVSLSSESIVFGAKSSISQGTHLRTNQRAHTNESRGGEGAGVKVRGGLPR